jgi:hypothetical protein
MCSQASNASDLEGNLRAQTQNLCNLTCNSSIIISMGKLFRGTVGGGGASSKITNNNRITEQVNIFNYLRVECSYDNEKYTDATTSAFLQIRGRIHNVFGLPQTVIPLSAMVMNLVNMRYSPKSSRTAAAGIKLLRWAVKYTCRDYERKGLYGLRTKSA